MDPSPTFVDPTEVEIPRAPECAHRAREVVRDVLGAHAAGDDLDGALLVASELVTNAWKHGEGAICLRVEARDGCLRIEVIDEGSGATAHIRPQEGDESGGWGLRLVDDLAVDWGCFEGTTHVWAEVAIAG